MKETIIIENRYGEKYSSVKYALTVGKEYSRILVRDTRVWFGVPKMAHALGAKHRALLIEIAKQKIYD